MRAPCISIVTPECPTKQAGTRPRREPEQSMLYRQRLASLLPSRLQAVSPETWRRHWRTILAVKVTGVIVSVALAVVLVPEARTRDLFVALTAGVYLPISFLLYLFQRRDPTPPNPV